MENKLIYSFRQLREAWFNKALRHDCHERQWEEVGEEEARNAVNKGMKKMYDEQTEKIIAGEYAPVSPHCMASMMDR